MENVKLVLGALFSIGEAVDLAKANDGKFTFGDLALLIEPGMKVPGAVAAASAAEKEWMSGTDEQKAEVIAWLKNDFVIHDQKAEKQIEAGIAMLVHAGAFFA